MEAFNRVLEEMVVGLPYLNVQWLQPFRTLGKSRHTSGKALDGILGPGPPMVQKHDVTNEGTK